ncbi:MAG: hypothetical protein Q7R79_01195 [bacterium]|nr:hypothetical protein [bacterium]
MRIPATIAGYAMRYHGRWEHTPGFYSVPYLPLIKVRNTRLIDLNLRDGFYVHVGNLMLVDQQEYRRRLQELHVSEKRSDYFVCEPPDTSFWEGDWVRVRDGVGMNDRNLPISDPARKNAFMISSLDFTLNEKKYDHKMKQFKETSFLYFHTPEVSPLYRITDCFRMGPAYPVWHPEELELVERGNILKETHGEPLTFSTLEEETFFLCATRKMSYVAPPAEHKQQLFYRSSLVPWKNQEVARAAVLEGAGHGIRYHFEMVDWSGDEWWEVISFHDEELGIRVREATRNGFVIPSYSWIEEQKGKQSRAQS